MSSRDEYPTTSETRIATPADERKRIEFALNQAESHVARMEPSPTTTRLKVALEIFRRSVDSWNTRPPTAEQLDLLREHVEEVLQLARSSSPTIKLRSSA